MGTIGIWSSSLLWQGNATEEAAAELDELGYGTLWLGTLAGDLGLVETVLGASQRLVVATGVVNVWLSDPDVVAAFTQEMSGAHPDRFLLGIGSSHAPAAEAVGRRYEHPLAELGRYLNRLDTALHPVPVDHRILAALGPKALDLAARRSAGAHLYLVTPEHTETARRALGPDKVVATEQKVVLESDRSVARAVARDNLRRSLPLDNYRRNLLRLGFDTADFEGGGSDRLIDALFALGSPHVAASRVAEHFSAGANHVCLQAFTADQASDGSPPALPRAAWRALAEALL